MPVSSGGASPVNGVGVVARTEPDRIAGFQA
jgi:hypothetical protein